MRADMARPRPIADQHGFTVIEVMLAALVLIVGLLGSMALIDRANAATATTQSREAANSIARELLKGAHHVDYDSPTPAGAAAVLQTRPGLADSSTAPGWTIERRRFTYTVSLTTCTVDDARDGIGAHDATYCAGTPATPASGALDTDPEDYKRVTVDVSWSRESTTRTVRQTGLVANTRSAGPGILTLTTASTTVAAGGSPQFAVTTSEPAMTLDWSVDGAVRDTLSATAAGGDTAWSFVWNVDLPAGPHLVSVQAFDAFGRSAGFKAITIDVQGGTPPPPPPPGGGGAGNRPPNAPPNLVATVESNQKTVSLAWGAATDPHAGDSVVKYRVYRDGALLAEVTGTTYSDATWGKAPRAYVVKAVDSNGAESAASNTAYAYPKNYTP